MDKQPLVSILSPVYNGEGHIEDCIKGVLNQTYENFEYIMLDNACTDGTPSIIEKYRSKDSRIRVFRNEKTICMEDNFNSCAGYASADSAWLKYALADDFLFPDCVRKMVDVGELDEGIGIVSAYRLAGEQVTNTGLPIDRNVFEGSEILKQQILRKLHVVSSSPNTVMYRRRVFQELNGYNSKYDHSDTELAFRLLDKYKVGFVHEVLTRSGRESGGGEYSSIMHGRKIMEYLDFGYANLGNYKSIRLDKDEWDYLRRHYAKGILNFMMTKTAYFEFADVKRVLSSAPVDIRGDLKKAFFKECPRYCRVYLKALLHLPSHRRESKRMS